jgi:CBS domain-containing protein
MNNNKIPTWVLVIASVITGLIFYVFLFIMSKWFPEWTGRTFTNDWILVLVSAIPLLIVLIFILAGNISKARIAGIELEFDKHIPGSLIESFKLDEQISHDYLMKGRREELDRIIQNVALTSSHPIFLLVPLEGENYHIDFRVMRQYIYKLTEVAPIRFIVFVGGNNRFLGFTTIEIFRATFPRFGIELVIEDFENENIQRADLPTIFNRIERRTISSLLDRLIYRQWNPTWNPRRDNERIVKPTDMTRLGASDLKVNISTSPSKVYWLLMENEIAGIPVIDTGGKFVGIVTKE